MPAVMPKNSSLRARFKESASFLSTVYREWNNDHPDLLAAGLGYFSLFSLIPLLIISMAALGYLWAVQDSKVELTQRLASIMGEGAAGSLTYWLTIAGGEGKGKATLVSMGVLLVGASKIFTQVRTALNIIWDVKQKDVGFFKDMFTSLGMNIAMLIGLLCFLVSFVVLDGLVALISNTIGSYIPGYEIVLYLANTFIPLGLFTLLFAVAYKCIPETHITWSDVWPGAIATALMMGIGKIAIAFYLKLQSFSNVYGTASSCIVMMVWIYFAAQIFFFGAEFTWLWARTYGSHSSSQTKR